MGRSSSRPYASVAPRPRIDPRQILPSFPRGNPRRTGEPDGGIAVRGRAPVAARRERAARADLGSVGQRAPLELAGAEEYVQEYPQPFPDLGEPVAILPRPRAPGEERDLGGRVAEAQRVEIGRA